MWIKSFSLFFVSLLVSTFLLNADDFEQSVETVQLNCFGTSLDCSFSKGSPFAAEKLDFVVLIEEVETNEEEDSSSLSTPCFSNVNSDSANISVKCFDEFKNTEILFIHKEARYIQYSSLKIPFPAA